MTPQTNAIASANNLVALAQQTQSLYNKVVAYMNDYTQTNPDNYWQQMPTVNVNADGTLAGTNDAAPNTAHPINVPQPTPLLLSRSQLINGITMLQKFQLFMSQAGGTLTLTAQANTTTAANLSPNTVS